MAESTLSIDRTTVLRRVARFLGITTTAGDQATQDSSLVSDAVKAGEAKFYNAYDWPFLRPVGDFILDADEGDCELPDDFGGFIEHELHYMRSDNAWYPIQLTSVAEILKNRGMSGLESTSFPSLAATAWLPTGGTQGQRQTLMVWPKPSTSLVVRGQYHSIPNAISSGTPYPLGGQPHGETLVAACLAAAELMQNNEIGPQAAEFDRLLAASIRLVQNSGPKHLGNMGRSRNGSGNAHDYSNHYVSYAGSYYLGAD